MATTNNHYVSRVFLKSWLSSLDTSSRKLLVFNIKYQNFKLTTKGCSFAAEDFLYSFIDEDGKINDDFEAYLQEGENAWGKLLNNLKKSLPLFSDDDHFERCLFLLVSFTFRDPRHIRLLEDEILNTKFAEKNSPKMKLAVLDSIEESIETRVSELLNREVVIFETPEDTFYTCERPFFDFKTTKFKKDMALIAISPRHLIYLSDKKTEGETSIMTMPSSQSHEFPKLLAFWNESCVMANARTWVVSTDCQSNRLMLRENFTTEKVEERKKLDVVRVYHEGKEINQFKPKD